MMATLRCDHPDILDFVKAKHDARELRNFNLSVLVSDAFMAALDRDEDWPLVFPADDIHGDGETLLRRWSGGTAPVPCRVLRQLPARELWHHIMLSNYDYAEPGVLFIDRINQRNNLHYCEQISATNPCGEIPLPPYGACNLGAVNLTRYVRAPFSTAAALDLDAVEATVAVAVRMLDNVVETSRFPVAAQSDSARRTRRLGLGFTGLADALIMLGLRYDSAEGRDLASTAMGRIREAAYRSSIQLAEEKGAFPAYDKTGFLSSADLESLPGSIRDGIARHGLRNSHLTAIAPCGTISLLANNVSSGIEPVFALQYRRRIRAKDGGCEDDELEDYAWRLWRQHNPHAPPPDSFVTVEELRPTDHLAMQAAVQPHIDSAISKTINVPESIVFEDFETIYREAYRLRLKGCTCFRPNPVTGVILSENGEESDRRCCTVDREAD